MKQPMKQHRVLWSVFALLVAACDSPPVDDGAAQITAELRALHTLLATRQEQAPPGLDVKGFREALAPMQQAVRTLVDEQGALQQRQLALAEELARWSGVLAATANPEGKTQLAALQQRLQQLEAELQAQDQRHREVEAMVQKALDGTSDRLDAFLKRVENLRTGGDAAPAPAPGTGNPPAVIPAGNGAGGDPARPPSSGGEGAASEASARKSETAFLHGRPRGPNAWLWVVLACGLGALGFVAWRWARPATPRPGQPRQPLEPDRDTEDLWQAATLLSEAVGRLRPTSPAPLPSTAIAELPPDGVDDLFVLDALDGFDLDPPTNGHGEPAPERKPASPSRQNGGGPASTVSAAAPAGLADAATAPPRWSLALRVRDRVLARATVAAYLAADPRVLRRPAPVLRDLAQGFEVECALLPGLMAGEREHLRATLERLTASM